MSEKIYGQNNNGGITSVHVKDGKIVRIRPKQIDPDDFKPWKITASNGKTYSPPRKVTVNSYALTEKQRVYSEDRILYPLKRIDFDPKGNRHPETRGKSGYERISWDEALDIVSGEIKRMWETYGREAVCSIRGEHCNWGNVNYRLSAFQRFINMLGTTHVMENPDSWEGWHWGATHTYGFYWRLGAPEFCDLLEDSLKHSDMVVYWAADPDAHCGCYSGQESVIWRQWLKDAGKKQIVIDPYFNYTCADVADKWIAPRPGTDAAMILAMMYIWIKEDTYDKDYIAKRTVGFEEFKKYVLGESDGVPKTTEWAAEITDIPARVIRALAREWAAKKVQFWGAGFGGPCRQAYGTEWARLSVLLQAMQGLGKPGVSMNGIPGSAPYNADVVFPGYADPDGMIWLSRAAKKQIFHPGEQFIYRLLFAEAILNPPTHWLGEGYCPRSLEQQFTEFTYPAPGKSEAHMIYMYGSSFMSTFCNGNDWIKAFQSPKIEFVTCQEVFWCNNTRLADVILPACTNFERNDISGFCRAGGYVGLSDSSNNYRVAVIQNKCIEPLGESKADYDILALISERLGLKEEFTEGKSIEDWMKGMFEVSDLPKYISWEEFNKKGHYVINVPDDYKPTPALRWFYEGRPCDTPDPGNPKKGTDKAHELGTYSGKIEFVSQSLLKHLPDDEERPPMPRYIPSWEGHESELAKKYPLQLLTPHPRYSFHTNYDSHSPWLNEIPGHRVIKDGYAYLVVYIHPSDAEKRGIQNGDIVKLYNDRGAVLGAARVTERLKPGVIRSWSSVGKYDPVEPGKPGSIDRGGCMNILTTNRLISKNVGGFAPNSCLIEIKKWEV